MSTENATDTSTPSGASTESASSNASTPAASAGDSNTQAAAAGATAQAGQAAIGGTIPADASVVTPPAFTPNFKYKSAMQEKEIDEFWRPLIKDADSEKKVKDLFTKTEAFDYMKEKYDKKAQDYDSIHRDFTAQTDMVNRVLSAKKQGDYGSVMRNLGITDHDIIRYAAQRVDYLRMMEGLPPEQRQSIEAQQQAALRNETYEEQLSQLQQQNREMAVQARTFQLDQTLSRPDVSQAVTFWDNKMGTVGAFRDQVIEEARAHFATTQQDLSPEQAVQRVLQKFGRFIEVGNGQVPTMTPTPQTQSAGPQVPGQKPVIPAIPGGSKAPIKKQFKSIDDLKKHAKEMEAQEAATL